MTAHADDQRWMRAALTQARYGLGRTWPNPSVGCVIVQDGALIGMGRTADGGRPHAESEALKMAGDAACGATAYVTLEPCAHHGQTPPCADALIEAGIRRVTVGLVDPDHQVAGEGIRRLEDAGIIVTEGAEDGTVSEFYQAYLHHRTTGRPMVTAKIASTLDGKIALPDGRSKWITGDRMRQYIHLLRSQHDAILTSSGTVRADNPQLTCRLDGYDGPQSLRIVVASRAGLDLDTNLAQSTGLSRIIVIGSAPADDLADGVESIIVAADDQGYPAPQGILEHLGQMGVTSVMVEAGGTFLASLLKAGVIDRLVWTRSSGLIGGEGRPSLADLGLGDLEEGRLFSRVFSSAIEDDAIEIYMRTANLK
jgi:diaminohydroxyphosphoribosylaminopyrimidine deaminase/5-amino-6-(5-phosphoribosylamino)uracil reductase